MKITVTAEHIRMGKLNELDCERCPLALAVREHGFERITTMTQFWYKDWGIILKEKQLSFPPEVQQWHSDLMADKDVQPITFELEFEEVL